MKLALARRPFPSLLPLFSLKVTPPSAPSRVRANPRPLLQLPRYSRCIWLPSSFRELSPSRRLGPLSCSRARQSKRWAAAARRGHAGRQSWVIFYSRLDGNDTWTDCLDTSLPRGRVRPFCRWYFSSPGDEVSLWTWLHFTAQPPRFNYPILQPSSRRLKWRRSGRWGRRGWEEGETRGGNAKEEM